MLPRNVLLRDGRSALIRRAVLDDAEGLLELERATVRAGVGVVKYEDELPPDVATFTEHVRERLTQGDGSSITLVAEVRGAGVIGEGSLTRLPFRMLRHVGVLALGVHPLAQRIGVGRALLAALLDWARSNEEGGRVLRVELYTRADNMGAISLYRAMGFTVEGTRRSFHRLGDGTFVDDILMGLLLDEPGAA